jgi:hypothetical protein
VPKNRKFKFGAAIAASAVGVILAITSVAAHSTPATSVESKSIVGNLVSAAVSASFPLVQQDPADNVLKDTEEAKAEAAEDAAKAAAEAAAALAEQQKEAAEAAALAAQAACTSGDQLEDTNERSGDQTEDATNPAEGTAADQTEDANEKAGDKLEDAGEAPCPEAGQVEHSNDDHHQGSEGDHDKGH